eukprot:SAG22_NODE_6727_length_818_cov_4.283727_1_plen_234_part_10
MVEAELLSPCKRHRYRVHDAVVNMVIDLGPPAAGGGTPAAVAGGMANATGMSTMADATRTDADGRPVHTLYRRKEKVELSLIHGAAEPGPPKLQAEAAALWPAVSQLVAAHRQRKISDSDLVACYLLAYIQVRRKKSWLCGARNGKNAHRQVVDGTEAGYDTGGYQASAPQATAQVREALSSSTVLPLEFLSKTVPFLALSLVRLVLKLPEQLLQPALLRLQVHEPVPAGQPLQ